MKKLRKETIVLKEVIKKGIILSREKKKKKLRKRNLIFLLL